MSATESVPRDVLTDAYALLTSLGPLAADPDNRERAARTAAVLLAVLDGVHASAVSTREATR